MAGQTRKGEVFLKLYGKAEDNERVRADVFARKLATLIRAVSSADKTANGGQRFDYLITDMKAASAAATMIEHRITKTVPRFSGAEILGNCLASISDGQYSFARKYPICLSYLKHLSKDSEDKFSYAELSVDGLEPVRIDQFFHRMVSEAATRDEVEAAPSWYKGWAHGSFDGKILEVDIRGSIPKVKLILTAGGRQVDCTCPGIEVEELRAFLDNRVRVNVVGRIYYDGTSGFPTRIEIRSGGIRSVKPNPDIRKWEGAFNPFKTDGWDMLDD